jgi:hypothetical protein
LASGLGGRPVSFLRLAVTPEQVARLKLPTAVGKDRLAHTVQAEAIPPDELARIVRDALEQRLDPAAGDEARRATERARKAAIALLLEGGE